MPLDWRSLQGLPEASAYGSHTDIGFRDTYFCASHYLVAAKGRVKVMQCSFAVRSSAFRRSSAPRKRRKPRSGGTASMYLGRVTQEFDSI